MSQQLNGPRALYAQFESCPIGPDSAQDRFERQRLLIKTLQGYAGAFFDNRTNKLVCIKAGSKERIEAGLTWDNIRVRESFTDEIRTMTKISAFPDVHPGICRYITDWETEDQVYLAMEYIPGGSLLDFANHRLHGEESLAPSLALREYMGVHRDSFLPNGWEYPRLKVISRIMHQTVNTMAWAHSKSICHLDLSLENIMLVDRNLYWPTIKIIDFGVALDLSQTPRVFKYGRHIWLYDQCVGKANYMAPEVGRCRDREVRRRNGLVIPYDVEAAEIFTFGSILFMLIFGRYPPTSLFRAIQRGRIRNWFADQGWSCWMTDDAFDCLNRIWAPESTRITMAELQRHPFIQMGRDTRPRRDGSSHSTSNEMPSEARHQSIHQPCTESDHSRPKPKRSVETQSICAQTGQRAPTHTNVSSRVSSRVSVNADSDGGENGFFLVRVPTEGISDGGETTYPVDPMDVDPPRLTQPGADNRSIPMDIGESEDDFDVEGMMTARATCEESDSEAEFQPEGICPHRTF